MKTPWKLTVVAVVVLSVCGGYLGWRAHADLVTLHVRNASVASVVSSLRWQTWEKFIVNTNVTGTITLDVDRMPLDNVLGLLSEQLGVRWTALYPIYRDSKSLSRLEQALRGELPFSETHYTNYHRQVGEFRGDAGLIQGTSVNLHLTNTDLAISALALEKFGGGRVLVESGSAASITLEVTDASFKKAVQAVAQSAHRSTTRIYALEAMRGPGRGDLAGGDRRNAPEAKAAMDTDAETARLERLQQVWQTLPEDQRKEAEQRELDRLTIRSLPAEQRQQVMSERMSSPEMQARAEQRNLSSIKNSTPEQRRDRYERMFQMRKARAAGVARNG